AIFSVSPDESIRVGLRATGPVAGSITIRKGEISILPALPLDKGWYSTAGSDSVSYENGVRFQPRKKADRLYFPLVGPAAMEGKIMHITIAADEVYIRSGSGIKIFVFSQIKDWPGV